MVQCYINSSARTCASTTVVNPAQSTTAFGRLVKSPSMTASDSNRAFAPLALQNSDGRDGSQLQDDIEQALPAPADTLSLLEQLARKGELTQHARQLGYVGIYPLESMLRAASDECHARLSPLAWAGPVVRPDIELRVQAALAHVRETAGVALQAIKAEVEKSEQAAGALEESLRDRAVELLRQHHGLSEGDVIEFGNARRAQISGARLDVAPVAGHGAGETGDGQAGEPSELAQLVLCAEGRAILKSGKPGATRLTKQFVLPGIAGAYDAR